MKKRKWLSLLTLVVFCTTLWPTTLLAAPPSDGSVASPKSEKVSVIVELEGTPVLAQETAKTQGARAYVGSDDASDVEADILHEQSEVLADIAELMATDGSGVATASHKGSAKAAPALTPSYTYTHVLNAFAIECDSALMEDIEKLPGVKGVYQNRQYKVTPPEQEQRASTVSTDVNDMNTAYLHAQGIRGEGQVVAVIDTELDVQHEFFAGEVASPTLSKEDVAAVIENQHLNVNATADEVYHSSKLPFVYHYFSASPNTYSDNLDEIHGTPTSGIAVGRNGRTVDNQTLTGIAPEAQLLFFGVGMPNSINMATAAIIAALDDAVKLGADVINASYCNYYSGYSPIEQTAHQNIGNAGIFLAAAAGNNGRLLDEGQTPLTPDRPDNFTIAFPSTMDHVTSVAAAEVSAFQYETYPFHLEGSDETLTFIDYSQQASTEPFHSFVKYFNNQTLDTVYCGDGDSEDIADKDLRGKIAVFHRNQRSYTDLYYKYYDLSNLGAIGVILIKDDDDITPNDIYKYYLPIPTALVLPKDSAPLKENPRIHFDANEVHIASATAKGTPSDFSSWGVATDLTLNPDISAPGNGIYTAFPSASHDQYTHLQGTSVATPHIAGAAALLKQYIQSHPEQYASLNQQAPLHGVIKNLMMSTATPMTNDEGMTYSPRQQGAGVINLKAAAKTPVILLGDDGQSKLSLGNDIGDNVTFSFTAQNLSDKDVTYDALEVCVNGDDVNADGLLEGVTALETTDIALPDAVTVPAGGSATIDVRIDLDKSAMKERMKVFTNGFFVDGYVTLATTDGSVPEVHLPFTGFYGDWAAMTAMDAPYYSKDSAMKMTGLATNVTNSTAFRLGTFDYLFHLYNWGYLSVQDLPSFPVNEQARAYSAISPNGDGLMDDLSILVKPLRELKVSTLTLRNQEGKVLYTAQDDAQDLTPAFKSIINPFIIPQDVLDSLPEGDYEVTLTARFNYEGSKEESLTLPFAVDRQSPTIKKCQVNEDGILHVDAEDNRALMGVVAIGVDANGNNKLYITDTEDDTTPENIAVSFDISALNPDSLKILVIDYAGNIWIGDGKDDGSTDDGDKDDGGSSSGNKTETTVNPDGSTTTTVTRPNGSKTETTKYPDGSKKVVDTKKDGTVTTTLTDKDGTQTETVEKTDGSSTTDITKVDGSTSTTTVSKDGDVDTTVTLPSDVIEDAKGNAIPLPMPEAIVTKDADKAPTVTVDLLSHQRAKVEVPVKDVTAGTVAILVKEDGTEEIIKTTIQSENGVIVTLADGDTIKIVDNSKDFADVADSFWAAETIDFATSRGLFGGTGDTTFSPNMAMNRAMIVTVLARLDGADTSGGDVWYEKGREWAMKNGISDGNGMMDNLTREQLVTMLWRYADKPNSTHSLSDYKDAAAVSDFAKDAFAWAVEEGIITGTDVATLSPQGTATRAQVAAILTRFCTNIAK